MDEPPRIFFKMNPRYANRTPPNLNDAARYERVFVLRYLVSFWQVGIKIILTVELGKLRSGPPESQANLNNFFNGFLINNGECSRVSHANSANINIGMFFIRVVQRVAKHLCASI